MHPLSGIRVIECGVAIAGPMAARILGHLGAEVIKIDNRANSISAGPPAWAPKDIGKAGADLVPGSHLNGEKFSFALDLKAPQARPIIEKLVAESDVFLTNLSVPAIESLRLTYNDLRVINPRLVYIAMPGFGFEQGPYREYRSWGPNLSSLSGLDYLTGDADSGPVMTPLPLPDYVGAYHAVTAVQGALLRRDATGEGGEIRMAQFETTVNVLGPQVIEAQLTGIVPGRTGNQTAAAAPRELFPCSGHDRWVAIEVFDDADWQRLIGVEGMPGALRDQRFATLDGRTTHVDEIYTLISEWTVARTNREAAGTLQAAGVAGNPVQNSWDHLTDPQLEARGYWKLVCHDRLGLDLTSSLPAQFSETPARYSHAMPSYGYDTERLLGEVVGLDDSETRALIDAGVAETFAPLPEHLAAVSLDRPSRTWAWPLLRLKTPAISPPASDSSAATIPLAGAVALESCLVLDLSDSLSAYGTYLLARMGAEVVRIEPPGGHALRKERPLAGVTSTYETFMDGGKSSRVIDLETEAGRGAFRDLAARADVIYDSSGPGVLAKLGLGWDALHMANPRLSLVSVTPFGETGPYHGNRMGELGAWALSSMLPITGYPDRRPMLPGGALAANLIGATGAYSTLAALNARTRTGRGQRVDVSAHEVLVYTCSGMLAQIEDGAERQRSGVRALGAAPYGFFQCADRQVSLLALFPNHWAALSAWIFEKTGNATALEERFIGTSMTRYRFFAEIEDLVNSLAGQYNAGEFCSEAQGRGVPAMPVNSVAELLSDPHLEATGFWDDVELADGKRIRWPGPPFRTAGLAPPRRPPGIGEQFAAAHV